jgi:hypothetical protein
MNEVKATNESWVRNQLCPVTSYFSMLDEENVPQQLEGVRSTERGKALSSLVRIMEKMLEGEMQPASRVLDQHIEKMITLHKEKGEGYVELEKMKQLPEYGITVEAMQAYATQFGGARIALEFGRYLVAEKHYEYNIFNKKLITLKSQYFDNVERTFEEIFLQFLKEKYFQQP